MTPLKVKQLQIRRQDQIIIENLSFQLEAEQRLCLQGEIGVGKSTLLFALLGFVPVHSGEIWLFDQHCQQEKDFIPFRGPIGLCFQHPDEQLFGPTVLDDVAFGVLNQGFSQEVAYQRAAEYIEQLGITHLQHRAVHLLSGGEKNFTALAGVLAMRPKMLFLDEPTNGLDSKNKEKLERILVSLKLPMIIASHDLEFSARIADDHLQLHKYHNNT